MKKYLENKSWRTTALGVVAMVWAIRAGYVVWVHGQNLSFNLFYVETGPVALLIVGWALLHARDHRCKP
jgi:hypothetical protein